jgi:hypothetical protein
MASGDRATAQSPTIRAALSEKRRGPEGVLDHIGEGDDLVVGMFNSEPLTVLDAIEAGAERLSGVRVHQMFPFRERRYMHGAFPACATSPGSSPRPTGRPSTRTHATWYPTTSARYRP